MSKLVPVGTDGQGQRKVVSAVSASGPREGRGVEGGTGGSSGQAARRRGGEALGVLSARLTQKELAVVAASTFRAP
jgi:hypothetical protein